MIDQLAEKTSTNTLTKAMCGYFLLADIYGIITGHASSTTLIIEAGALFVLFLLYIINVWIVERFSAKIQIYCRAKQKK